MMRGNKRETLDQAFKRFKENTPFLMSSVQFPISVNQQYIHTPLKMIVDMNGSKFDPIMKTNADEVIQAQPGMTLSEVKELMQNQQFDITALVSNLGKMRKATQDRSVMEVTIIDNSASESKVQQLKWSLWTDLTPTREDSATIDILRNSIETNTPLSFFALNGKKTLKGFQVDNSKDFFVTRAIGARAQALAEAATQLHAVPEDSREIIEQGREPSARNFNAVEGTQTFCQILKSMAKKNHHWRH